MKFKYTDSNRGKFLTIVLFLSFVLQIWDFSGILDGNHIRNAQVIYKYVPDWFSLFYIAIAIISIVDIIAIWFWNKWAILLEIGTSVIYFFIQFFFFEVLDPVTMIIFAIIFYAIYFGAIYRKWKYFK